MDPLTFKEAFDKFFTTSYTTALNKLLARYPDERTLFIDWKKLEKFNSTIADAALENPDEAIQGAKDAIDEMDLKPISGEVFKPNIRFYNIPFRDPMIEDIGVSSINKLISFKALVVRRGAAISKVRKAAYVCPTCGEHFTFLVTRDFKPPSKCPICKKGILREETDKMKFIDFQMVEVQEILERIKAGTPAAKLILHLEDDLVNTMIPGENVEITGILRVSKDQNKGKKGTSSILYKKYLDAMHIKRLKKDFEEIEISKEEERKIKELAAKPNIKELMIESVAPDIYGYKEIKLAMLLQLFGGTKGKKTPGGTKIRDDIHILLVGDPGIAKTRFLQNTFTIAPKSIYVSGKTVSGVGLTASAEKDELSGNEWTLKAGALVLASGGIAAIDEFDKISEEDRSSLHEVMESGTVSIAKAGIVTTLRSKTAIISAANPKAGRFIPDKPIPHQFNIPPSLMSRFDLIFPIIDQIDQTKDERLASFIIGMHKSALLNETPNGEKKPNEGPISKDLLRKYIAYARAHVKPRLGDAAGKVIQDFYLNLRLQGKATNSVPITPRYLEGLIRLAEAHAKMRLATLVEPDDAQAAVDLMYYVMKKVMSEDGIIDSTLITSGKTRSERKSSIEVLDIIDELQSTRDEIAYDDVINESVERGLNERIVKKVINELLRDGYLYEPAPGLLRKVEK